MQAVPPAGVEERLHPFPSDGDRRGRSEKSWVEPAHAVGRATGEDFVEEVAAQHAYEMTISS
jgi:hypothetical protein